MDWSGLGRNWWEKDAPEVKMKMRTRDGRRRELKLM